MSTEDSEIYATSGVLSVIKSYASLESISSLLSSFPGKCGSPHLVWGRDGQQKTVTFVLMDDEKYQAMEAAGYCKPGGLQDDLLETYYLSRYRISNKIIPSEGKSEDLFVRPSSRLTSSEARSVIVPIVNELVEFGVVPRGSIRITIPTCDRESGEHLGKMFVNFSDEVPLESKIITRLMFQDASWYDDACSPEDRVQCCWKENRTHGQQDKRRGREGSHTNLFRQQSSA